MLDHSYSIATNPAEKILYQQKMIEGLSKGNKTENERKRRLTNKVQSLSNDIKSLLAKVTLDGCDKTVEDIDQKASSIPDALVNSIASKRKKSRNNNFPGHAYCDEIKEFSLSLHNASPRAYRYVRENLDFVLPCESTLRQWMNKIDCSPGFQQQEEKSFIIFVIFKNSVFKQENQYFLLCDL